MKRIIFFLLFSVGLLFAQDGLFGTSTTPLDTATLTNTDTVTSRWIYFRYPSEGVASLFIAADSSSGTVGEINAEYQLYYGVNINEADDLYGPWTALDSVLYTADTWTNDYGTGSMVGRITDLADNTYWAYAWGIRFRFWGTETQTCLICARFAMH